jgi:hypothetical protein
VQRQPADLDELRISTMTRTTTCQSGGFTPAMAPPPAVAPLHKFIAPTRKLYVHKHT